MIKIKKQDRINKLQKLNFIDLYRRYYQNIGKDTKFAKDIIDDIRYVIDMKEFNSKEEYILKCNYLSYPDYNESNFRYNLSRKAEFFHCKGLLNLMELENRCSSKEFELGNHQQFLKNFMNKNTPYKGLLVFHGVGVGKTCSAVTISNSFRDVYKKEDKKIICLVSKNIQPNWRNTIYDPTKGEEQCSGDSFQHIVREMDRKNIKTKVKRMINEYYDFYGYQQFSNKIKYLLELKFKSFSQDISDEEKINLEKEVIESYFSNRVLIVDEIHNLRDDNLDEYKKETIFYLDKVIKYSKNLRLILMSATPMFNKVNEIQWLLNLLLKNDGRPTINQSEIFDKKGYITDTGIEILKQKTNGYVSYVRGENPITFPIRLYPMDDRIMDKYPINDIWGNKYGKDTYQFKFLKMYYSEMDSFQKRIYNEYLDTLDDDKDVQMMDQRVGAQISNIVYPSVDALNNNGDIDSKMYGKGGFKNIMKIKIKNKNPSIGYTREYKQKIKEPIFDLKNVGSISTKIQTILNGIQENKSKGIIFIYSEFLSSGLIPLALTLEHMGFSKYSGNILDYPEWSKDKKESDLTKNEPIDFEWNPLSKKKKNVPFKQAKYIILSGDKDLSPNNNEEIEKLVSDQNKNGENIKIILGSVVASEGLDLKNIREIHILDPWYHLSRVEQIVGRGIRYCSHIGLDKKERNVTVFMHVAGLSRENESIDTLTYRKAEEKAYSIGQVEKVFKENSIDCYLNKQINIINKNDIYSIDLITSRHTELYNHEVHDKPFSKVCSFSDCDYNCDIKEITEKDINYDTFSIYESKTLFKNIQKIISEMYEINNYYTLDDIIHQVNGIIDTNDNIIYFSLYDMIENNIIILNKDHISGSLINRNDIYLFQPHNNTDQMVPLYYRNNFVSKDNKEYIPLTGDIFNKVKEKVIYNIQDIYKKVVNLNKYYLRKKFNFEDYIPLFNEDIFFDISLDNLTYDEKVVLLKPIIKEYIETKQIVDENNKKIFDYFKNLLLWKDDKGYYLLNQSKKEIIGFFLFNTERNKTKKKKELDDLVDDYDYFIFKNGNFYLTSELDDGELIRNNLKQTFFKKNKGRLLPTEDIWGYSYKLDVDKTVFKFVETGIVNKMPGRVIEQIAQKSNIRKMIQIYFNESYEILNNEEESGKEKTKEFLSLLIELIIRDKERTKNQSKYFFIPYDLIFLKYI
tara:strand:- start:9612 stop:13187 length:3576 start_codon:yes stop_codon:yes gene_type:complete